MKKDNRISLTNEDLIKIYHSIDNVILRTKKILKTSNLKIWRTHLKHEKKLSDKIFKAISKRRNTKEKMKGGLKK